MKTPPTNKQTGVALVTTVIVIAVLAVVAVAFMQSTTSDRFSSRSVANYSRAKLAAEAGMAMASSILAANTTNDTFIVTANTSNQLFVGNGISNSANFSYVPLLSALTNVSDSVAPIVTGGVPFATVNGGFQTNLIMPGGLAVTSPVVSWIYMTNADGVTNARFAFWVEDLSGKLDLSVVGTTNATVARRPTGTNPQEIALWSLFSPGSPSDPGNTPAQALVGARTNILTAATARVVDGAVTSDVLADLAANLQHDTNEPELIPFGFSYADEGVPKYNLNTNISAAGVNTLATVIAANLPNFDQRSGGFPAQAYNHALATSLVDYADVDNVPTFLQLAGTDVRGLEALPFVNERVTLFNLDATNAAVVNGVPGIMLRVRTQDFYEFWNPASVPTQNASVSVVASNNMRFVLGFASFSFAAPTAATNSAGVQVLNGLTTNQFTVPVLAPNEFFVASALTVTNLFFYPGTNAVFPASYQGNATFFTYSVYLNGVSPTTIYDKTQQGCFFAQNANMQYNPSDSSGGRRFFGSYSGFGSQAPLANYRYTVGDPRMMFYINDNQDQITYATGSSFGGRNFRQGITVGLNYKEVLPSMWPDSGHWSPAGNAAGTLLPTQVPKPAPTNLPVGRISDAGFFTNASEVGAVFDPIQWRDPTLLTASGYGSEPNGGQWTLLTASGAQPDARFGGGNTLRIGRAEHPRFTNDGLRAAQLLDLFSVGPTNSAGMVVVATPGRININTASTNALVALAAGVNHVADPALQPGGTNYFPPASALQAFAQGVTNFRGSKPFYSVNQLPSISTNGVAAEWPTNAVFGNTNPNVSGVTAWNDAAAEEWFSKIHALATVRSRNFVVHAIGETVATNAPTTPLASYRVSRQVYVAPLRTNGMTTNASVQVLQSWEL